MVQENTHPALCAPVGSSASGCLLVDLPLRERPARLYERQSSNQEWSKPWARAERTSAYVLNRVYTVCKITKRSRIKVGVICKNTQTIRIHNGDIGSAVDLHGFACDLQLLG